jgi:chromosome segregation ATPase
MENQNKIKNNNDKDKKDDDDQDKKDDDDICDKKCRLASINSHISMIDTRLNLLEKNSEKNDILIKNNKDNINKTSTELKKLQDEINTAKKELEEATKSNKSY